MTGTTRGRRAPYRQQTRTFAIASAATFGQAARPERSGVCQRLRALDSQQERGGPLPREGDMHFSRALVFELRLGRLVVCFEVVSSMPYAGGQVGHTNEDSMGVRMAAAA